MGVNFCFFAVLIVFNFRAADTGEGKKRSDDTNAFEVQLSQLVEEVTSLRAQLEATNNKLQNVMQGQGSTYVRWGRTECPPDAELVYAGRAGGSLRENRGRSPNRLCLPMNPQYDHVNTPVTYGRLYGALYLQVSPHHDGKLVPCAVCHVPRNAVVMVPAILTCPQSWQVEYSGHLSSEDHNYPSIAEYVCLDRNPEDVGASNVHNGTYFYYTLSMCGTLPCPPYVDNAVVTCVVCSK